MIFIDSDCIIDFLNGKESARRIVEQYSDELATSQVNVFEIFFGIFKRKELKENELMSADRFFSSLAIFSFDQQCGKIGAKIFSGLMKEGNIIDQNDCFIGSIMIKNGINTIISNNKKHFSRIKGIKVVTY